MYFLYVPAKIMFLRELPRIKESFHETNIEDLVHTQKIQILTPKNNYQIKQTFRRWLRHSIHIKYFNLLAYEKYLLVPTLIIRLLFLLN